MRVHRHERSTVWATARTGERDVADVETEVRIRNLTKFCDACFAERIHIARFLTVVELRVAEHDVQLFHAVDYLRICFLQIVT